MRRIALAHCIAAAAIAAFILTAHDAAAGEQWQNDFIVFGRGASLWRTDPRGKANPQLVANLPEGRIAADVSALKTDAAGRVLLAEISSKWYWLALDSNQPKLQPLACGPGGAELAPQANYVVCAGAKRGTAIIRLADGVVTAREVPAQGARLVSEGTGLDLIWADKNGVWRAPLAKPKQIIKVAGSAPSRDFSVSPDGSRAVGFFDDPPHGQILFGFALDGIAARRKGIKAGIPLNWSHDGMWVLVQDGTSACLMRTLGGQYKCWKGYVAGAAAPDGHWQLMFGNEPAPASKASKGSSKSKTASKGKGKNKNNRPAVSNNKNNDKAKRPNEAATPAPSDTPAEPPTESGTALPTDGVDGTPDESGDDEPGAEGHSNEAATATMAPLGKGPHNLYRGQLEGAFTDPPALVVRDVAGAVVWVPVRTPPITSGLPAYAPSPASTPTAPAPPTPPVPTTPPTPAPAPGTPPTTPAAKAPKVRTDSGPPARR